MSEINGSMAEGFQARWAEVDRVARRIEDAIAGGDFEAALDDLAAIAQWVDTLGIALTQVVIAERIEAQREQAEAMPDIVTDDAIEAMLTEVEHYANGQ